MKSTFALLVAFVFAVAAAAQTRNLEIYWIDVEGGASTLFVSPTGESLLFDTGFPGNGDRMPTMKEGLTHSRRWSRSERSTITATESNNPTVKGWRTTKPSQETKMMTS